MFVDGPGRDAVTIEISGTHTAVRGWLEPGVMALTNHFELPEPLGHQTLEDVTDLEISTVCRHTRLRERLPTYDPPYDGTYGEGPWGE